MPTHSIASEKDKGKLSPLSHALLLGYTFTIAARDGIMRVTVVKPDGSILTRVWRELAEAGALEGVCLAGELAAEDAEHA